MWQWATFILMFLVILTLGVSIFSGKVSVPLVSPIVENITEAKDKILGVKDSVEPKKTVEKTKEESKSKVESTAISINTFIDNVLGQKTSDEVEVTLEDKRDSLATLLEVDLSEGRDLKLSLKRGKAYQIKFSNIPSGFCLYIANQKYELDNSSYVSLKFSDSGSFPIKMDYCEATGKNIGELQVN